MTMKTVILAAGFGSRLWPLSTSEKPKQFQQLINGTSLLKYTYTQLQKTIPTDELYVLILEGMQELVSQELPSIDSHNVIVVPERRSTLPHTLWALSKIVGSETESVLFKSVDHFILDEEAFIASLSQVINDHHDSTRLTLLCTKYATFNSNDGYCVADRTGEVVQFLEKPSEETLNKIRTDYDIYRSPMIYITSKNTMRDALEELSDEWLPSARALLDSGTKSPEQDFLNLPFLDISNAVFQRSHKLQLAVIDYQFIDVGRFQEIYGINPKDANGNVIIGKAIIDGACRDNLIINRTSSPIVIISKSESVIVQTLEGSLVSSFTEAHKIGDIYKQQIHQA